ncbi:50S ribosomal protein L16 [Nanoarchaeota archaeon]
MAKLRKGVASRTLDRPFTRRSKYRKKSFVKTSPASRVVRYNMGDLKKKFPCKLVLRAKESLQLRDNCIESARVSCNRVLEKQLGKGGFRLVIRMFPHHYIRENPLASGAGADRMSTGMQKSYGKVVGRAAQIKKGQEVLQVEVEKSGLSTAKLALKRAYSKLPNSYTIEIKEEKA